MLCDLSIDEIVDDVEEENESNLDSFFEEIKPLIISTIKNYFKNKKSHTGSNIQQSLFDLPYYVDIVLKTTVSDGVLKAYKIIEENNFLDSTCEGKDTAEDIRYIVNLIKEIQKFVPQEFVGGMLLLHLELVEGLQIW